MKKIDFHIKFKVGEGQAEELKQIYQHHAKAFKWNDEHEQLLSAHLLDMYARLDKIVYNMGRMATLTLNVAEALAFYQYWSITDTSGWPLANVLICDMIKKIDQRGKRKN